MFARKSRVGVGCLASMMALAAALPLAGCGNLDTIVMSQTREVSLPKPHSEPALRHLPLFFEHTADIPESDVDPASIDSVRLTRLEIVLPTPSQTRHLAFIRKLDVYVQAPNRDSVLVASSGPLPKNANAVSLDLQDVELREYLVLDGAEIRAEFRGVQPPEQLDVNIEADFLIDVSVKDLLF